MLAPAIFRTLVSGDRPGLVDMILRSSARPSLERGLQPPEGPSTRERQAGQPGSCELRPSPRSSPPSAIHNELPMSSRKKRSAHRTSPRASAGM